MEKSSGRLHESDMFDECKGFRSEDSFETELHGTHEATTLFGTWRRWSHVQRLNAEVAFEVAAIPDSSDRCLGDEDPIVSCGECDSRISTVSIFLGTTAELL